MKQRLSILIIVLIFLQCSEGIYAQKSSDLLNKSIAFHDPLNKWSDYSGKVFLTTVFANGENSGGELIEIQTKDNYYRCENITSKVVRGVKDGKLFREINGDPNPGKDLIEKNGLSEDYIIRSKNWHYLHFGVLMELKNSGLILQDDVESLKLEGKDCMAIKFLYDEGKLKNQGFKNLNLTVYIDPKDFSMCGYKLEGRTNAYALFSGIMTINDIKLPLCRTYFNTDNTFRWVDVFSYPVTE